METIRVALAQINPTVGDLSGNRDKVIEYIHRARKIGADIAAFPELALTGYPPEDLLLKKHFMRDNLKALKALRRYTKDIAVVVGFVDSDTTGALYNAAAVIYGGNVEGVFHKIELPNYGVFDEKRYFSPGNNLALWRLGRAVLGINICEDIWKPKGIALAQARKGAPLIINISASP